MIVRAQDSGVLEIFWRHRINKPFPRSGALDFLSRITHHSDVLRLRHWLAKHSGCDPVRNVSDAAVLEQVASAISSGEFVVAEHRSGQRWPGTGVVIGSLSGSVLLIPRRKLRPGHDLEYALEWLRTVTKPEDIQRLRGMLWDYERASPLNHDSADFYLTVEKFLQSGELIPVYHAYPGHTTVPLDGAHPPPAPPVPRGSEREDIVEASIFGPDHATAAQVAGLMAAAKDGVPFCEECEKARAQRNAT